MAIGMGELGWAAPVFWQSTLPDLLAAYRGYHRRQDESYRRAGTIAAALYNVHRKPEADPIEPADLFPWLRRTAPRDAAESDENDEQ